MSSLTARSVTAAGSVVTQVEPNSPGAKAGLKVGDVIAKLDGKQVNDAGELQAEVGLKKPGTTIRLDILRNGKGETLPVTLEEMGARDHVADNSGSGEHGKARWGLGLSDLRGAIVANVQDNGPAAKAGLRSGDVITSVGGESVKNANELTRKVGAMAPGSSTQLTVLRQGKESSLSVTLGQQPNEPNASAANPR